MKSLLSSLVITRMHSVRDPPPALGHKSFNDHANTINWLQQKNLISSSQNNEFHKSDRGTHI